MRGICRFRFLLFDDEKTDQSKYLCTIILFEHYIPKGWGQNAKLGPHCAIWEKLGTALQAYALNPCTKFPPNPTSRKVNT